MFRKVIFGLLISTGTANAASFDCSKAHTVVEKLVCNTPSLSQADDELFVDYLQAKLVTGNNDEFKKIVKQNRKLREKNCETVECQTNWYKRSTELYRNIAASKGTTKEIEARDSYKYGEKVSFKGIIQRESSGFPAIRLADMISVHDNGLDPDINYPSEFGVAIMQLVINNDSLWDKFEQNKGRSATVICYLFHAETAHHKTPVMCSVENIKIEGTSPKVASKLSFDDFFKANPELDHFYVKRAIKAQALGASLMDSSTSNDLNKGNRKKPDDLLRENGYEYAILAVRQLQEICAFGGGSIHSLKDADCAIISSYKEK